MSTHSCDLVRAFNVRSVGHGVKPMIFAHGFGCDQTVWREITPAFFASYRLVLFDHVGCGGSDPRFFEPTRHSSLDGYTDDLINICDALNLKDAIFVGHSVSAMMGVLASIRRPDLFAQLVLIGPSPCYLNDGAYRGGFDKETLQDLLEYMDSNFLGWSAMVAPTIIGKANRPELSAALTESFCRSDPDIAKHFARVTFWSDNRKDLSFVPAPAVILQCADDEISPESVGEFVHRQIPGSHLVRLNATGHCPHLSDPVEVVAVLRQHVMRPAEKCDAAA